MTVLRILLLCSLAIALIAAPCRNCVSQPVDAAPAHDCCPKPEPPAPCDESPGSSCKWAPADTGLATEKPEAAPAPAHSASAGPVAAFSLSESRIASLSTASVPASPPGLATTVLRI
jgi:hypothetical protein